MAIVDVGLYQAWIRAFDNWERAQRRHDAAAALGNSALTEYLRGSLEAARQEYQVAIRAIKDA